MRLNIPAQCRSWVGDVIVHWWKLDEFFPVHDQLERYRLPQLFGAQQYGYPWKG